MTEHFLKVYQKIIPEFFKELPGEIHNNKNNKIHISPLQGAVRSFFISELQKFEKNIVLLLSNETEVLEASAELSLLGLGDSIVTITDFTPLVVQEKLTTVANNEHTIIISTYYLLLCTLPDRKELDKNTLIIKKGNSITYNILLDFLREFHYQSEKYVEEQGQYSRRGAIIDFWSYSENTPVRIEFDGDFIESIRSFDPENQRSIEHKDKTSLAPFIETVSDEQFPLFGYLTNPLFIISDAEFNAFSIKENTSRVLHPVSVNEEDEDFFPEINDDRDYLSGTEQKPMFGLEIQEKLYNIPGTKWIIQNELTTTGTERIELHFSPPPPVNSNYKILFSLLENYVNKNFRCYIAVENELQAGRFRDLFSDPAVSCSKYFDEGKILIVILPVKEGFLSQDNKILLFTDYQIFNKPYRTRIAKRARNIKSHRNKLESIKVGDFVVHEDYGIGRYQGLEAIKIGESEQECMKLLYAEGGIVYVNLNYLHLVKKYSSKEGVTPALSTLGTSEWLNRKKKARKKIKEAARELIELYAKRKMSQGFRFNSDTVWQRELEASFMYEDTPDQARVTKEVKDDMEAENPMDRLVCGDVGFGKTEIAIRAAFKAVQDGKQVAVLVPTTILAEQHYNTFRDRLSQFPVKIEALSRFQTKAEQKKIVQGLSVGSIDIVIGTHRLISKDVSFKDLGLLIIDEEHRFGVGAKEKIRSMKLNVDTLTLTATPIPRTLNLSLLGARDLSILSTPPPNRQPIYTRVDVFDPLKIRDWVYTELKRNGQVYIVHDRIASIEKFAAYLQRYMPDVKIGIAHGQMNPDKLEDVIHGFLHKKFDILLCTKIIESGIDIPNVNTIIINRADRFGLAELHQLRGRVGRSDRQAYAYLLVPSLEVMNRVALQRLKAIEEYSELGSGMNLAMRDLEIRGAGNLLGKEQSGFIDEIGFDLYVKLINEAVEELKQEEFRKIFSGTESIQRTDAAIEAYFGIGIPAAYMPDQMDRLSFYSTLYSIANLAELDEIKEEMIDRFGTPPDMVNMLLLSARLKFYASKALFERVIIQKKRIIITLPKAENRRYYEEIFPRVLDLITSNYKKRVVFNQEKNSLKLLIENVFPEIDELFSFLLKFTSDIVDVMYPAEENVNS